MRQHTTGIPVHHHRASDQSHPSCNSAPGYLAATFAQSGQIRKAIEIVSLIDEGDDDDDYFYRYDYMAALAEIAQAQAEAEDNASAMKAALSINDYNLRVRALLAIANMQAKGGDYANAIKIVMSIDPSELDDDELSRVGSLAALAAIHITPWQLARGDYEGAKQTMDAATPHGFVSLIISAIVYAKNGNFAAALAIADGLEDGNVWLLSEIAVLQARAGDGQAARQTLKAVLKATRDIDEALHRSRNISMVAAAHAKAGYPQIARQLLDKVQLTLDVARKATSEDDAPQLIGTLSEIAGLQAEAGYAAMGIETALGIDVQSRNYYGEAQRVEALILVARRLAGKPPLPWMYPRKENFFWQF